MPRSVFRNIFKVCLFLMTVHLGLAQDFYLDNFNSVSYARNDGTAGFNFTSNWIEVGETTDPNAGRIRVNSNQLRFNDIDGRYIYRTLNLSAAASVTLTFDYNATGLNDDGLSLWLRNAGGGFVRITTITGGSGTYTYNLPATYISANSGIAFNASDGDWQSSDTVFIDNVRFTVNPTIFIDDVSVAEEAGNMIFTVSLNGSRTGGFTVDFQSFDFTANANVDYTPVSGTLSFSGTNGETRTISVPIFDDTFGEPFEELDMFLSNITNGVTIGDNVGYGGITDTDTANEPLSLFERFDGYYDYTVTGGTLRTNDNNTDPCSVTTSSSNILTAAIPPTAIIRKAYLYWAHSGIEIDNNVTFEGQSVVADIEYNSYLSGGQNFFGLVSDVTDIVNGVANPSTNVFDFSDLTIDNDDVGPDYCSTSTVLGGWSLMVFYEEASLPAVTINLYQGFNGRSNQGDSFTLDAFYAIAGSGAKATFLSWEGDSTLDGSSSGSTNPEELSITNQAGTNFVLTGDGGQTGNNAYNSTIFDNTAGINISNVHGLDLDTYDISTFINPSDNQVTANVDVGQDFVISNAVVLKVPSNLITGTVFEDINYPGGPGRNINDANGVPLAGASVELYDNLGNLVETVLTDDDGDYVFAGMADGTYTFRVVNATVRSSRGGGDSCTTCVPVQTFRKTNDGTTTTDIVEEVGGRFPAVADAPTGTLSGAQSVTSVTISGSGIADLDFGFNFNTIVNTNSSGQGSLEQFIVNSNNLDEVGLNIEPNSIFDPVAGKDVSIFMIPPTGDTLGRTGDPGFASGIFTISQDERLSIVTADNTELDARTQTAYSGNTNGGTLGGGEAVGTAGTLLPNYDNPEIQIAGNTVAGDVIRLRGDGNVLRNFALYSTNNQDVVNAAGTVNSATAILVTQNLIGVDATGTPQSSRYGVQLESNTSANISNNYLGYNERGVRIDNCTSATIDRNHFDTSNPDVNCFADAISLAGGSSITITNNLLEDSGSAAIDMFNAFSGSALIEGNTIRDSGISSSCTATTEINGISIAGSNNTIRNNEIYRSAGAGITMGGNGTGNLISQNSIYANGTLVPSLGIDIARNGNDDTADGVNINDSGDTDTGANGLLNFPIITMIHTSGSNLTIRGWARPGSQMEFFLSDINQATATAGDNSLGLSTDYGEGQIYLGTATEGTADDSDSSVLGYSDIDGNSDSTSKFSVSIPLPAGVTSGSLLTATATLANGTSEFSPQVAVKIPNVITNRRITYRVRGN